MNLLSIVGFCLAALVLFFGMFNATKDPMTFLDYHAFLIVVGGTAAAAAIAFQLDRLFTLLKVFFYRILYGKKDYYRNTIEELMQIADAYRTNSPDFQSMVDKSREPFLKEIFQIAQEGLFSKEELARVMRSRVHSMYQRYVDDALKFKVVSRFPPAFGLVGTTLGMITLLQKLGDTSSQKMIGPAMSIALVATLYGLILSNLVFGPMAENLMDSAKEMRLKYTIIIEGVLLILDKTNPVILAEELNSFLLPGERMHWRKSTTTGANAPPNKKVA